MTTSIVRSAGYFNQLQRVRNQERVSTVLFELTRSATQAAKRRDWQEAIASLDALAQGLSICQPDLDDQHEVVHKFLVEIKVLQRERLELRLELARIHDNQDDIRKYEELLEQANAWFSLAIADLDPNTK